MAHFTQAQYDKAGSVSLLEYLRSQGYTFEREGRRYRDKAHGNLVVHEDNRWYMNENQISGYTAMGFLMQVQGMSRVDAVLMLANEQERRGFSPLLSPVEKESPVSFVLPEANTNNRRVFAYLNYTRGIDGGIINKAIQDGLLYESKEYRNCVFVGYDDDIPRYATMRGTYSQGKPFRTDVEGSSKCYPFYMKGNSNTIYAFESPVDALSHATLHHIAGEDWRSDTRLSLGGVADIGLMSHLQRNTRLERVILCLDYDEAGRKATGKITEKLVGMGYEVESHMPENKDWNDDLLALIAQYKVQMSEDAQEMEI